MFESPTNEKETHEGSTRTVVIQRLTDTQERIESSNLLGSNGKLIISHQREDYLLRLTKAGKLILTK